MHDVQYFQAGFKPIPHEKKAEGGSITEGLKISGYASTPTKDRYSDIVEPEAFRESIIKSYKNNPIILFQHDSNRPIGKAVFMSIDMKGLFIRAEIYDKEVAERIQQGVLRTFSIGFIPKKIRFEDEEGNELNPAKDNIWAKGVKRIIEKVDLVENSIVSTPANPDALFTMEKSVKSFFGKMEKAELKNTHNPITQKDMDTKENLLEKKEEDVAEEATPEPTENAENTGENPESVEEEVTETPADETSGEEEVVETDGEGEPESTESEEVEVTEEKPEESPEVEAKPEESSEAESPESEGESEKGVIIDPKLCTPENMRIALENVKELRAELAEVKEKLNKTPAKQALKYNENQKFIEQAKDEKDATSKEEKKGFKSALLENADY